MAFELTWGQQVEYDGIASYIVVAVDLNVQWRHIAQLRRDRHGAGGDCTRPKPRRTSR